MERSARRIRGLLAVGAVACLFAAQVAMAQAPPPKPKDDSQKSSGPPPKPSVSHRGPVAPPPPKLVVSSDTACRLELDGEALGELEKDVVQEFRIKAGEHLLQAFPTDGPEGPTWKDGVKAPDTGNVVVTIDLQKVIADWKKKAANKDRFEVKDDQVLDHETGLVWAYNVSPEMRWDDAQKYCQSKTLGGARGWRLPTLDELSKLYWADNDSPPQEMQGGETRWTIFGKRTTDVQVLPRMIIEPLEHNSVGELWISSSQDHVSCSFLGEFNCSKVRKKSTGNVLCVRQGEAAE